jgi:hypothetical protein
MYCNYNTFMERLAIVPTRFISSCNQLSADVMIPAGSVRQRHVDVKHAIDINYVS